VVSGLLIFKGWKKSELWVNHPIEI